MDEPFEFVIDLNMLHGGRVTSHVDFIEKPTLRTREPEIGETVVAIDEDGARYLAVIEAVEPDGFVTLFVDSASRYRPVSLPKIVYVTPTAGLSE